MEALKELVDGRSILQLDTGTYLGDGMVTEFNLRDSEYIRLSRVSAESGWRFGQFQIIFDDTNDLVDNIMDSLVFEREDFYYCMTWNTPSNMTLNTKFIINQSQMMGAYSVIFTYHDLTFGEIILKANPISPDFASSIDEYIQEESPIIYTSLRFYFGDLIKGG